MKTRYIRRNLYVLKRRYGTKLDLYHIISIVPNLETGKKITNKIKYKIRRAILLPTLLQEQFLLSAASLKADRAYPQSATQTGTKLIIIDNEDLPDNFEIGKNDYLVIRHVRYDIKSINDFEHGYGLLLTVKEVEGSEANEVFESKMLQTLEFVQTIDND